MWTRALLKDNAKAVLRRSYWRVFLACLIVSLLCGGDFNLNYRFGADSAPSGPATPVSPSPCCCSC